MRALELSSFTANHTAHNPLDEYCCFTPTLTISIPKVAKPKRIYKFIIFDINLNKLIIRLRCILILISF